MKLRHFIALLLAATLIFTAAACKDGGTDTDPETGGDDQTQTPDTALPDIVSDGVGNFGIIRSDISSQDETDAAVFIRTAIKALTGIQLTITTDWEKDDPDPAELALRYEILVGNTNRPESKEVASKLTVADEYIIEVIGNKIVIAANSGKAFMFAAEKFAEQLGYFSEDNFTATEKLSVAADYNIRGVYEMVAKAQTRADRPCIVETVYPTDDIPVADIILTDDYGADNTGKTDVTGLLETALSQCARQGGGTVWLPAGKYLITRSITIPAFVTLRGDWRNPNGVTDGEYGTVIIAGVKSLDTAGPALFNISGSAGVYGLTVFYPEQSADDVKPYPYTFYVNGLGDGYMLQTIMNVTVLNGYRGIGACVVEDNAHEQMTIDGVYGTFLFCAATAYNQADVGTWKNFSISADYWSNATEAYNAPDAGKIREYTRANSVGLILGDLEWTQFANVTVTDYKIGVCIMKGKRIEFAGALYDFNIARCGTGIQVNSIDTRWGMVIARGSIKECDITIKNDAGGAVKICGLDYDGKLAGDGEFITDDTDISSYKIDYYAAPVKPAAEQLYVFDGDKTGGTDISAMLAAYASAVNKAGGGIIYLPGGLYRMDSPVVIPDGMELRGVSSVPERDQGTNSSGTAILCYYGNEVEDIDYGQALITLGKGSGIRNIRILYPENKSGTETPEYTFAIRSTDDDAYAINCSLVGAYQGIDFNGADNFRIKKLVSYCYKYAVRAANCSGGIIEGCLQNGTVAARNAMTGYEFSSWPSVNEYTQIRTTLFYNYNVKNQVIYNSFAYGVRTLVEASECSGLLVANVGSDNIGGPQTIVSSGECVVINAMRYNGTSYFAGEGAKLSMYNRLTIGNKHEETIK